MRFGFYAFLVLLVLFRIYVSRSIFKDGDKIRITDKVVSEPLYFDSSQRIILQNLKIYLPKYPVISYADNVVVEGVVDVDRLKNPRLIDVKENTGFLYQFRGKVIEVYRKSLPEPHSSLVAGITLGSKSSMPQDFWEGLRKTGTLHVVVASGMNVTFVAKFLIESLVLFINRRRAVIVVLLGVWVYALLSGFDAPIVRASVMGSIAFGAGAFGRLSFAMNALFLSALIMLVAKPEWLVDTGFELSFLATLGLVLFESKIRSKLDIFPRIFKESLSATLSAQIAVSPLLLFVFGYLNLLSPLINVLILWTVPAIMIIGAIGGIVGVIFEPLGQMVLMLAYPLTLWFTLIIDLFS